MRVVILAIAMLLLLASIATAHPYKLDSYGCHNNSTLNVYECHSGQFEGKSWPNPGGKETMLKELYAPPPPPPPPPPPVCPDPPPCPVCPVAPPTPVAKIAPEQIGLILTWDSVGDGITYEVKFYARDPRDPAKTEVEIDRISHISHVGQHTAVYLGSILQDMNYTFWVRAVGTDGQTSAWSEPVVYQGSARP